MSKEIGPAPKIFRTPAVRRISPDEQGGNDEEFKKELQEHAEDEAKAEEESPEKDHGSLLGDSDEDHEPGETAPGVGTNLDIST
jgi:hypothetical protein